ncbi:MAG: DUF2268 domain-containing putative Zn-dependent protease [Gemmatimonadales bacterium]
MRTSLVVVGLMVAGCATDPEPPDCDTELAGAICLDLRAAGSLAAHRSVIVEEVGRTLDAVRPLLDVTGLRILLIADATEVIPEIGMGGFNPSVDEVRLYADPSLPDIVSVLRTHLLPQLAHEIHHAMRRRAIGYGSTLLQAAVSEGAGRPLRPRSVRRLAPAVDGGAHAERAVGLDSAGRIARHRSYVHAEWFFGTNPTIPRWTGYAVGFELVRAYLDRDPARRASLRWRGPTHFLPYGPRATEQRLPKGPGARQLGLALASTTRAEPSCTRLAHDALAETSEGPPCPPRPTAGARR